MKPSRTHRLRVLLVEDDRVDQIAFRRMTEQNGLPYDLEIVDSVESALAQVRENSFDVVLADYYLRGESAFPILQEIGDTPLIIVTGAGDEALAVEAMKAGASDYIVKDANFTYLRLIDFAIDNALTRKSAVDSARELEIERVRRETLETFLRDVSHDFRTPLTMLGLSLDLMERYVEKLITSFDDPQITLDSLRGQTAKIQERVTLLQNNRRHIERMISQMLEMVRLDNIAESPLTICDAHVLVLECVEVYKEKVQARGLTIEYAAAEGEAKFMGDETSFVSAICNLLENALSYSEENGIIEVSLDFTSRDILISIRDHGIGFPMEEADNIFKRFYRLDKVRRTYTGGSGLGLSIVKRVIDMHRGEIDVTSAVGAGSTFTIRLPRLLAAE